MRRIVEQTTREIIVERTAREIVDETNELARTLCRHMGYVAPDDLRFELATGGRESLAWRMACAAQELLTATDPNEAVKELENP